MSPRVQFDYAFFEIEIVFIELDKFLHMIVIDFSICHPTQNFFGTKTYLFYFPGSGFFITESLSTIKHVPSDCIVRYVLFPVQDEIIVTSVNIAPLGRFFNTIRSLSHAFHYSRSV